MLICWLALLLVRIAEVETGMSWAAIRRITQRLHLGEFLNEKNRVLRHTELSREQSNLFKKLKITPPKPFLKLSKVFTERELGPLADKEFKVSSLRFSTACGMSDRLRLDLVLNDFVAGAVASKKITILSDGTPWRPLINIEDMARAIDWACIRDIKDGGEFLAVNVGSDDWNYQVRELAEAVADILPGVEVSINKNAQPDKRSYRVNFSLFKSLAPNHQPQFDLRTTIHELRDGLEKMQFDGQEFRNSKYMRLKVLMDLKNNGLLTETLNWTHRPCISKRF